MTSAVERQTDSQTDSCMGRAHVRTESVACTEPEGDVKKRAGPESTTEVRRSLNNTNERPLSSLSRTYLNYVHQCIE